MSFTTLLKLLYRTDQESLNVIYTLPTGPEARDFVVSKFDPVIERSSGLREMVQRVAFKDKPVWSSALKKIGDSYYFFRGSWVSWRAQSIDADVLVVDELDFQKPDIRKMYEERLEGSKSKDIIYWLGYPSIPNYGISELYEKSDQREWYIKCLHCLKWQTLEWPKSISRQKKTYVCKFCRKNISDEVRKKGYWKAKYPERYIHGYAFNKLMAPWISARKILRSFDKDSPRHFHNFTLGLPYQDAKSVLTDDVLSGATINSELWLKLKTEHVVCGIDQGDQFHLIAGVVSNQHAIVTGVELLKSAKELEDRLDYYKPEVMVVDALPDKHIAKLLQAKYGPQKFFMANLRNWSETSSAREHYKVKRGRGLIDLERTESLDFLFESITGGSVLFKENTSFLQNLFSHLKNLVPDYQERFGKVRKVWKRVGSNKDDYAHALNFFLAGCLLLFPNRELLESQIVPSLAQEEVLPGSKDWVDRDFEKRITKLANPEGVIVIPPKSYKGKTPEGIKEI